MFRLTQEVEYLLIKTVQKIGAAESQFDALQAAKETPQEERQLKGDQDIFQEVDDLALKEEKYVSILLYLSLFSIKQVTFAGVV